jgi:hypothetical protein
MTHSLQNVEPLVDTLRMGAMLGDLSDKRGKIARLIHSGELHPLRRGLYATRTDTHPFCFAASIYGPSYISFDTALAYYGLIPEAVYEITSATLKRPKGFENRFGRFRYLAVPQKAYAIGIERNVAFGLPFLIASPAKALCDRIGLEAGMRSMSDVRRWSEGMRFNAEIALLDLSIVAGCAAEYDRPSVRLLHRTLEKYGGLLS